MFEEEHTVNKSDQQGQNNPPSDTLIDAFAQPTPTHTGALLCQPSEVQVN